METRLTWKRILVGVDGSEISKAAALYAGGLARATGAAVRLACSIEPLMLYGPETTAEVVSAQLEIANSRAASVLREIAALLEREGTQPESITMEGPPAESLAELAKDDVDLVVVGHRGRNALTRLMLGSVADRLTQICPKPVLVFR